MCSLYPPLLPPPNVVLQCLDTEPFWVQGQRTEQSTHCAMMIVLMLMLVMVLMLAMMLMMVLMLMRMLKYQPFSQIKNICGNNDNIIMVVDGGGDSDNALTCCLDEEWNRKALCPPQALLQPGGGTGTR